MLQINQSSLKYWNNLKLNWKRCADLPQKIWTSSVAELDGKVYITARGIGVVQFVNPFMYDSNKNQWSALPGLPHARFSLVAVPDGKKLLAIGGSANNGSVNEVTNKVFLWDEENKKWLNQCPDMPTARCDPSCISHGSSVIVAGGITGWGPLTLTRSVEILLIYNHTWPSTISQWVVVEQLPFATYEAVSLIVNDNLYIAGGYDENGQSICNIVTASLPTSNNISSSQMWNKLPDMPYSSSSINYYQGRLITFTGDNKVELPGGLPGFKFVPLIHIYNANTKSWDCVGEYGEYYLGRSVKISGNKILFVGGVTGTHETGKEDDIITTCMMLTLTPQ